MAKDVLITPLDGIIQFSSSAGTGSGQIKVDGDDLVINNLVGDVLLGDGASDVFIGNGSDNVDIVFEQSGEIRDDGSGKTITIGSKTTTLILSSSSDLTLQGGGGNVGIGTSTATVPLQVEGNISASGNFITQGHITASGNISSSKTGSFGEIKLNDDNRIKLGDGGDLQIYHNGSNSVISDVGAGDLLINGANVRIRDANDGNTIALFTQGAGVEMRHDNTVRFETTTTGVKVSGNISSSSHITASGNISASGTITMLTASIGGGIFTSASLAAGGGGGGAVSAVANGSNNRIATFSSADALNGEANLTFDGSTLGVTGNQTISSHITSSGNISSSGNIIGELTGIGGAVTGITSLLATDIKIGEDDETKIDFETANEIHFYANNVEQVYLADNIFGPQSDSDVDLGASGVRWKDSYFDTVTTRNLTTTGPTTIGDGNDVIQFNPRILVQGDVTASGNFITQGHITASGNISGSGTSTGSFGRVKTSEIDAFTLKGKLTAGSVEIEGSNFDINGGTINGITDLAVADGGTGVSTLTNGGVLLGSGTSPITAMAVLTDGQMIVGDGSGDPVAESGATLRTSIGVGTGDNVEFTNITATGNTTLGNATTDTHTITGHITASGNISASGTILANLIKTNLIAQGGSNNDPFISANGSFGVTIGDPEGSENGTQFTIDDANQDFTFAVQGNDGFLDITMTQDASNATGDTGALRVEGGASIAKKVFVGTQLSVGSHITASGNISSSGTITGLSGSFRNLDVLDNDAGANPRFRVGRNTSENIAFSVADLDTTITADQDSDSNGNHNFILNRTFDGSGANNFKIQKGGTDQFVINTSGHITASGDISSSGTIIANSASLSGKIDVAGRSKFGLTGTAQASHHFRGIAGDNNFFVIFDKDGEEVMKGSGDVAGGDLLFEFGDNGAAGNGTVYKVDDGNNRHVLRSDSDNTKVGINKLVPTTELEVAGDISASGNYIGNRRFNKTSTTDADAQGDIVYFGGTTSMDNGKIYHYKSDGTWELADADAVATCDGLLAVALGAASDTNGMLLRGTVTLDHDPGAVGDVLFVSTTAGQATATAPSGNTDIVRVIGYCLDASNGQIWFNPSSTFVEVSA